mmetsp:Transcript_30546/g.74398  ORF Transcript_30546/g.74398 Transcript_30546/m.74398 type:complete len:88 (+) Transcript_30546:2087-2350(+)
MRSIIFIHIFKTFLFQLEFLDENICRVNGVLRQGDPSQRRHEKFDANMYCKNASGKCLYWILTGRGDVSIPLGFDTAYFESVSISRC